MKINTFFFAAFCFLVACKGKNPSTVNETIIPKSSNDNSLMPSMQKFNPNISGTWVKRDYINEIAHTRSPYAARHLADGIVIILINPDSLKNGSIIANVGWNNHEGGTLTIKQLPGKKAGPIKIGDYDLRYDVAGHDTTLSISGMALATKKPFLWRYKRVLPYATSNLQKALSYITNSVMIAGNYVVTDSAGGKFSTLFAADGTVTGFNDFKTYYLQNDFEGDPQSGQDEIILNLYSKKQTEMTYKFDKDTVLFFQPRSGS